VAQQPRLIGTISAQNVARHFAGETLLSQTYVDVMPVDGRDGAIETYGELGYGSLE
jgi:ribose transport system substrate-binding protein